MLSINLDIIVTMKNSAICTKIFALTVAFIIALGLVMAVHPLVYGYQREQELKENCASYKLSRNADKKILIDIEEDIVSIKANDLRGKPKATSDGQIDLPLKKASNAGGFEGCTSDAMSILNEVQEVYQDYITESCSDFKLIIEGEREVPTKNGITANVDAAREFYDWYCPQ